MVAPLTSSTPVAAGKRSQRIRRRQAHGAHLASKQQRRALPLPQRTPLSPADQLWLQLPNMVIHAALVFRDTVSRADVVELVRTRIQTMPRFCRRLVTPGKEPPYWEMTQTPPEQHVRFLRVAGTDGTALMQAAVEQLRTLPLDPAAAPWDMTLVHGDDATSVLVTRIHHAVSDGRGLVEAILRCDEGATAPTPTASRALQKRPKSALAPLKKFSTAVGTACKLAMRKADPLSSIKTTTAVDGLSVTWLPTSWALEDVKRIASALGGGTVNDVVLTAVSGCLRRYMESKGDAVDKLRPRCLLPFNLAPMTANAEHSTSGNFVGGGLCALPVFAGDRRERFAHVHAFMLRLKRSAEPLVSARIMSWFNNSPRWIRKPMHRLAASKCTVFVSNVVGPQDPMRVAGHNVDGILWFVPPLLNIGLGFPVISYCGRLCVGISAAPNIVPDIDAMQNMLADEYEELLALAAPA